jgi:hypothetical protein
MRTVFNSETRSLPCVLTDFERTARANRAAELSEQAGNKEATSERLKNQAAALKKEHEAESREAGKLLQAYRKGEEAREINCDWVYDDETRLVGLVRSDTGERIDERHPTAEDLRRIDAKRQLELPQSRRRSQSDEPPKVTH